MKKGAIALLAMSVLIFASATYAQEGEVASEVNARVGILPDSPLYGIDLAIDNIRYLLTLDNTAKGKVGLEIARERLLEAREMIIQNKLEAAERAENEHIKSLDRVKIAIMVHSRANTTKALEEQSELEKEIEEHESEVETVSGELKIRIKTRGQITPEQQQMIDSILAMMQNKTGEVKIEIENKRGETKLRLKAETGRTDVEIENVVREIEVRVKLHQLKLNKSAERIDEAQETISEVRAKLSANTTANSTAVNRLLIEAENHLEKARIAFNETRYGEAYGQATAAMHLAVNADRLLEKSMEQKARPEKKIEVEIENQARVKIMIDGTRHRYILPTTNVDEILQDISAKTGLTVEEVRAIAEIESD